MSDQTNDPQEQVKDNKVVSLEYSLRVDDEIVDSTEEGEPIQFIQGQGQIISGLEKELYGMQVGDQKKVDVPPSEGYGEEDESAYAEIPKSEFPRNIPLEEGVALQLRDQSGEILDAVIDEVGEDVVTLNFNHPLAGKELHFEVKVVDLRDATEEEIEHGHVHAEEGEEDEDWDEEDEDDKDDEDEIEEEEWEEEEEEWEEEEEDWEEEEGSEEDEEEWEDWEDEEDYWEDEEED